MIRPRWSALALLIGVFAAGVATGAGTVLVADRGSEGGHRHERGREGYVAYLAKTLELSPTQRDSVKAVLARHKPAMDSLWRETHPRYETLRQAIRSEIRTYLDPEQREKYAELLQRREARRREKGDDAPPR